LLNNGYCGINIGWLKEVYTSYFILHVLIFALQFVKKQLYLH
jgi:hypothetical protein